MMDQLVKSPDFTWAMSKVFIWSCCEPFVGIVCACLPTYAPLVRSLWRRAGSSYADMPDDGNYASDKSGMRSGLGMGMHMNRKSGPMGVKTGVSAGEGVAVKKKSLLRTRDRERESAMRGDDEIELTVDIKGLKDKDGPVSSSSSATGKTGKEVEPAVYYHNEIMVRKDFSWESSS